MRALRLGIQTDAKTRSNDKRLKRICCAAIAHRISAHHKSLRVWSRASSFARRLNSLERGKIGTAPRRMRHRAGRNALRVLRFRGDGGTARRPSLAQRASRTGISRWREQERMIGGCSLLCAQLHRHVAEKLCAESAHNHSAHTPLARGKKPQPGKSQNHVVVLCGTLSPSNGFIRLTRWRFGLTTGYHSGIPVSPRVEEQKDEKNAREELMSGEN